MTMRPVLAALLLAGRAEERRPPAGSPVTLTTLEEIDIWRMAQSADAIALLEHRDTISEGGRIVERSRIVRVLKGHVRLARFITTVEDGQPWLSVRYPSLGNRARGPLYFLKLDEAGEDLLPLGQYVSKGTCRPDSATLNAVEQALAAQDLPR